MDNMDNMDNMDSKDNMDSMDNKDDASLSVLEPQAMPRAVFPAYYTSEGRNIAVTGSVGWRCADFAVKDEQGEILMKGRPGQSNFWGTKSENAKDEGLYVIYRQLGFSKLCTILRDGKEVMTVREACMTFKVKLIATFTDAKEGGEHTYTLESDWKRKNHTIKLDNGLQVASITRSYFKSWGNHYAVKVAPGVDLALISALCICLVASAKEDEEALASSVGG
ncbi:hypothetical protein B9479_006984 [Cryptococcus floricola]|uniref:Tubby C-terminal domain-containing protein n=1 Tax=Cryptococcus floricola TaxID=2591691 RepID=A0A5D3AQ10_9TREE|nr:hypothetical protein B9479_006984 [Cryptococcus floricola]